jgi:uncharacterized protein (DUF305 family)
METEKNHESMTQVQEGKQSHSPDMYLRFGAMILTAMVVMYAMMYVSSWEWSHVRWSESRLFMVMAMGGSMGLVMLGWMLNMYRDSRLNVVIVVVSLLLLAAAVALDRSQTTVQDNSFMSAMIPHHSIAILRSERAKIADLRVCELAVQISESQRREILEMEWLMDDIKQNGLITTLAEAEARPIPEFEVTAERRCGTD